MTLNSLSKQQQIQLLKDFIKNNLNEKEMSRYLAVKLAVEGYVYQRISKILEDSVGFISKWNRLADRLFSRFKIFLSRRKRLLNSSLAPGKMDAKTTTTCKGAQITYG